MLPKTKIIYSYIYNKVFDKNFNRKKLVALKQKCNEFEELYKKHIKKILKLIKKYSGKWKVKYIPIYIVEKVKYSFSHPLTLKYSKNPKYMLVVLIHELLHNNITKKFKDSKELHKFMKLLQEKIIKELPIDLTKELKNFNKIFNLEK